MTDVFISYSRQDMGTCLEFVSALEAAGINYWLDKEGIESGAKWGQIISRALYDSKLVVLLVSDHSLNSDNVFNEIDLAVNRYQRAVVPVLIGKYPDGHAKLDYLVYSLQHIELNNDKNKFGNVISYLKNKLGADPAQSSMLPDHDQSMGQTSQQHNPSEKRRLLYWTQLLELANQQSSLHSECKPGTRPYVTRNLGKGFMLAYVSNATSSRIDLFINNGKDKNKESFHKLLKQRQAIDEKFGEKIIWQELPGKASSRICVNIDGGTESPVEAWPGIHARMVEAMMRFSRALPAEVVDIKFSSDGNG